VNQSLYWKKNPIEHSLLSFENAFKVRTDWLDEKHHDNNKKTSLNGVCVHVKFSESENNATGGKAVSASLMALQAKEIGCSILKAFCGSSLSRRTKARS
jgi:hypothetical protein